MKNFYMNNEKTFNLFCLVLGQARYGQIKIIYNNKILFCDIFV